MGCGDEGCPLVRAKRREEWSIPDPKEMAPGQFRDRDALTPTPLISIFALTDMKTAANVDTVDLMFLAFSTGTGCAFSIFFEMEKLRWRHRRDSGCPATPSVPALGVPAKLRLVETRRLKRWTYYSLLPATTSFHRNLIHCLNNCFRDVPELKADADRGRQLRKRGGCCS